MPSFEDYDKDEEQQGAGGTGVGGGGGGGGGAQLAQATPQKESTFVPWSRFVSANEDVSKRNANALNSQVSGDVNAANKGITDASDAFNKQIESNYQHSTDPVSKPNESFGTSAAGSFGQPSQATQTVMGNRQAQQTAAPPDTAYRGAPQNPMGMLQQGKAPGTQAPGGIGQKGLYAAPQPGSRIGINAQGLNNPAGAKDLESSLGKNAWSKLTGDVGKAEDEVGGKAGLGSETGLQALIQKQAGAPLAQNGAFDAALDYGQGRPAFQQTIQAGNALSGNLQNASQQSQNAWHSLMGDVSRAKGEQSAYDKMNQPAPAAAAQAATPAAAAAPTDTSGWSSGDDTVWNSLQQQAQQDLAANGGQVVIENGGDQSGGLNHGAFGLESGKINVGRSTTDKSGQDTKGWWGGADGPKVGDSSIDAATWYALARLPPDARARWWKHNHPDKG